MTSGLTPTPTLTTASPPASSVNVMDVVPVFLPGDTVKTTGPGPGPEFGDTSATCLSLVDALIVVDPGPVTITP